MRLSPILRIFVPILFAASLSGAPANVQVDTKTHALSITDGQTVIDAKAVTLTLGGFTIYDGAGVKTVVTGSTSGAMFGATGNKIGFLGATPIVRQTGNIFTALTAFGFVTSPSLTIGNVTSLQSALDAKAAASDVTASLALKVTANGAIISASKTKITYDTKGLVTSGADATTADIADSSNRRYVTDAQRTVIQNTSGTNTGDQDLSGLVPKTITVNGHQLTGNVSVTATDVGLGHANDTSDADKPVSTAQQTALNSKANDSAVVHNTGTESVAGAKSFGDPASFYSLASNSIASTVLATPGAPIITNSGTPGASTWTYSIVAKLPDGATTVASVGGSTTTGNATLDNSNYNNLSWTAVTGAASYDVYRVVHGLVPSTTGKIANVGTNLYSDKGAAGDSTTAPTVGTTGRVTGAILDKGGAVFNVRAYGATGDGVTNDSAAIDATITAAPSGAIIYFPPGVYRQTTGSVVLGNRHIRGAGHDSSILLPDLATQFSLQLGQPVAGAAFSGSVSGISIRRAAGTLVAGTMGISAEFLDYVTIEDVKISRQAIGLKTTNSWSSTKLLGLILNRVWIYDSIVHLWLKDIAETWISQCNFGKNGGESIAPTNNIIFDNRVDDVRIQTTTLLPRISPNNTVAFKWINTPANNAGYYRFQDINIENPQTAFQSDSTCLSILDLEVTNSRISLSPSPTPKIFDFNAATALGKLSFVNNKIDASSVSETITAADKSNFSLNTLSSTNFIFAGGDWTIVANKFHCASTYSGSFSSLVLVANSATYDGISDIPFTVTSTSPNITSVGNTKDYGSQPLEIFPSYVQILGGVPFATKRLTGTLDGSGNASLAHGVFAGHQAILDVKAWSHGAGSDAAMFPMSIVSIDATALNITGGNPGKRYRVYVQYAATLDAW